jgi:archaemetzincin
MIFILPIGGIPSPIVDSISSHLEKVFETEVRTIEEMGIPESAFDPLRNQYKGEAILRFIPSREGYTLGIIDEDLYSPGLNFIFGIADPIRRVAIISITRLKPSFWGEPEDEDLYMERIKKEAVHEMGHLYGLPHCDNPLCVMFFSNTIGDTDRKSSDFCKSCKKLLKEKGLK